MRKKALPKKSAAEKRRERKELIEQGLSLPAYDPPRRFLALDDWGEAKITPREFSLLREKVGSGALLVYETDWDESIARACLLLFALVESGGLCVNHPEQMLPKIKLNREAAFYGYLRQPGKNSNKAKIKTGATESKTEISVGNEVDNNAESEGDDENPLMEEFGAFSSKVNDVNDDEWLETDEEEEVGMRQPLHLLGKNHLLAFTYYRREIQKAVDGNNILPSLPRTAGDLRLQTTFPWLKTLDRSPKWTTIFNLWLKFQITQIREEEAKNQTSRIRDNQPLAQVSWSDVTAHAAWSLLRREKLPIVVAYRRRLFSTTLLPEEKVKRLLTLQPAPFGMDAAKYQRESENDTFLPGAALGFGDEDVEESAFAAASVRVRGYLTSLLADDYARRKALIEIKNEQKRAELQKPQNLDLLHLLMWTEKLIGEKRPRTVDTYGKNVLRFLTEIAPQLYEECDTSDVASYIDNTCNSPNTVRGVRQALVLFAEFLEVNSLPYPQNINWESRQLKAFEEQGERDILNEAEYQTVRQRVEQNVSYSPEQRLRSRVLLTLLRRCGLRVSEASWLECDNLLGLAECRLMVPRSKTGAGRGRMIPLHLLLDQAEIDDLEEFFEKRHDGGKIEKGMSSAFIFVNHKGERSKAENLGREAQKLLRDAGIDGETAHGLRHALASSLYAALCLKSLNESEGGSGDNDGGGAAADDKFILCIPRKILGEFCREGIEDRAVSHPVHIQQILGHADMFVTFSRYIHLVELTVWDAVEQWERESEPEVMTRKAAAHLIRFADDRQFREKLEKNNQNTRILTLREINNLLHGRL